VNDCPYSLSGKHCQGIFGFYIKEYEVKDDDEEENIPPIISAPNENLTKDAPKNLKGFQWKQLPKELE
jgi:hypothetical protein